jgi:hypothetical protein
MSEHGGDINGKRGLADAAFDVPAVRIMGGRCGVSGGTVCVLATIAPIAVFRTVGRSDFVPQGGTTSIRPCRWTWTTELSCSCRHCGAPSLAHPAAAKLAAAAERAVADDLHVERDRDRKAQRARLMTRSNQGRLPEASHLQLQEGRVETAHLETTDCAPA